MKKLLLILPIIILFLSCENDYKKGVKTYSFSKYSTNLIEINIDGCQYLYGDWGYSTVLTHKGNCNNKDHYKQN